MSCGASIFAAVALIAMKPSQAPDYPGLLTLLGLDRKAVVDRFGPGDQRSGPLRLTKDVTLATNRVPTLQYEFNRETAETQTAVMTMTVSFERAKKTPALSVGEVDFSDAKPVEERSLAVVLTFNYLTGAGQGSRQSKMYSEAVKRGRQSYEAVTKSIGFEGTLYVPADSGRQSILLLPETRSRSNGATLAGSLLAIGKDSQDRRVVLALEDVDRDAVFMSQTIDPQTQRGTSFMLNMSDSQIGKLDVTAMIVLDRGHKWSDLNWTAAVAGSGLPGLPKTSRFVPLNVFRQNQAIEGFVEKVSLLEKLLEDNSSV